MTAGRGDRFMSKRPSALRLGTVALCLSVAIALLWKLGLFQLEDRAALVAVIERVRSTRFISIFFVATYAMAAAVGVPATPLTLAGGALFGAPLGIALNWLGEFLAALLAFAIARATGLRAGTRNASNDAPIGALSRSHAFATLFRLRLVPVAPFALLNAGAAISGMSWKDYIGATALGIVPVTIIYTVSASELLAGAAGSGGRALAKALASAGVLIGLSFLPSLRHGKNRSSPRVDS